MPRWCESLIQRPGRYVAGSRTNVLPVLGIGQTVREGGVEHLEGAAEVRHPPKLMAAKPSRRARGYSKTCFSSQIAASC